jgi:hypothetical protein
LSTGRATLAAPGMPCLKGVAAIRDQAIYPVVG